MPALPKFDVVSIADLSVAEIERIFALADGFEQALARGTRLNIADGLIMATLFYEPSTRTRLSFESAMHRLGGAVISSADMHASSASKGESLADTVRVVSRYADLIVIRHPHDGAARVAAEYAPCPVINAGDGSREHPTQTLCDLYTLRKKKGSLSGMTVAICGDLRFGRTVHSLIYALARFGANVLAVPHRGLEVPEHVLERIATESNYSFSTVTVDELQSVAGSLDALYLTPNAPHQMALFTGDMPIEKVPGREGPAALDAFYLTRLQRERLSGDSITGDSIADDYVRFDARSLRTARAHEALVMHPLPRTTELAYELDTDPRAVYFEQAAAGVPVRMALVAWMLSRGTAPTVMASREPPVRFAEGCAPRCANPTCVTRNEGTYLQPRFTLAQGLGQSTLVLRCDYCERDLRAGIVGHSRTHRFYRMDESLDRYVRQWMEEGSLAVFDSVKHAEESGYEPYRRGPQRELMDTGQIAHALDTLAGQIIADFPDLVGVAIVGVVSRGAMLAARIRDLVQAQTMLRLPCAALNIYAGLGALQPLGPGDEFEVEGRAIVLVDDVINSGWTTQRAMTMLWRYGRPAAVKLAVLIDRGHREVPIRPDYVGRNLPTARTERVEVRLERPGADSQKSHDRAVIYSLVDSARGPGKVA